MEIADDFAVRSDFSQGPLTETYTSGMALERKPRIAGAGAGLRLLESRAQGCMAA
jgi:hypothetical protein